MSWPIFGICQGFETLHWLTNNDDPDTMTEVVIYGESRPLTWTVEDPKASKVFENFPAELLTQMSEEDLQLHAHDYTVATATHASSPALNSFFDVLAIDEHDGTEFIVAVQAKDYPIAGTMHHPET